jgi:hypothetical protein
MCLEGLRIVLVSLPIDRQMTRRAPVHLRDAHEVHVVDDVRQHHLLHLQGRRHEVGHRRIAQQGLGEARRNGGETVLQTSLLGLQLVHLFLNVCHCTGVLSELRPQPVALRGRLLHDEVELRDPARLRVDVGLHLPRSRIARFPSRFEVVAIDVVRGLRELVVLRLAVQAGRHLGDLILELVDLGLIGLDVLPSGGQLLLVLLSLANVDALLGGGQLLPRDLHLELGEPPLRVLPLAVVVVPHHPDGADEEHDARRREHDVQEVDVVCVSD